MYLIHYSGQTTSTLLHPSPPALELLKSSVLDEYMASNYGLFTLGHLGETLFSAGCVSSLLQCLYSSWQNEWKYDFYSVYLQSKQL